MAPQAAREALEHARKLAASCTAELRALSYLLHPPLLDEVGLVHALQWYVDGFMARTEIVVRVNLPTDPIRLPAAAETTIFRIVQEALTNVYRHSGSRRAWIDLEITDSVAKIEIRDEGCGVDLARVGGHESGPAVLGVGVSGMRERLRHLGGTLEIVRLDPGTLVRAVVPVFNENEEDPLSHR